MPAFHASNALRWGPDHLPVALEQLATQVTTQMKGPCTYHDTAGDCSLTAPQATHLFRIAQEATTNARKHGSPSDITIALARADAHLHLRVRDDGVGFDPAAAGAGLGLSSMQYRTEQMGGRLEISSPPGHGTTVSCRLPLDAADTKRTPDPL